jgi:TM2 domain-containing membrane protein YozV
LIWWFLFIIYLWISWVLWYKAYNWEEINISFIDDFDNKKTDKNKDSSDKDEDILNF